MPAPPAAEPREASTLFGLLSGAASSFGDKTALQVCRSGAWTKLSYRELLAAAEAWGQVLAQAGLSAGGRALLVSESAPEWGVAYFAISSQGAAIVPLDPQLGSPDIMAIAARTGARVWLLSQAVLQRIRGAIADAAPPPRVFVVDQLAKPPAESHPAVGTRGAEAAPDCPEAGEFTASILFTSGTTLAPKGVPLTHRNFLSNVQALLTVVPFSSSDHLLSVLPMHHALEFTGGLLAPLTVGATVTYLERVTPKALLETMQATRTSVIIAVPRLLALLVRAIRVRIESSSPSRRRTFAVLLGMARLCRGLAGLVSPLAPSLRRLRAVLCHAVHARLGDRLRLVVSGGAALPPDIYDALDLMGLTVCEGYGLTETAPVLTVNPPRRPRRGTVGPPLPGVELRIEEPDADGVGGVLAKGPCVFSGYLDDPQASHQAFCGEWFRTGDLGGLDRHGYLVLAGRADDVIVTGGGKNVYPVEVEWLYRGLPHVKDLCVIGLPDPAAAGDAVHAVVTLDDLDGPPPLDARKREVESAVSDISRRLPTHQRIRGLHFWEGELPRTNTLKVKRKQLRDALRGRPY